MIRSCEDIKTLDDFKKLVKYRDGANSVGLEETASIICWDKVTTMNPDLFNRLFKERLRLFKKDKLRTKE